jgi:hypothetical protein
MTSSSLPGTDAFSLISPQDAVKALPAIVAAPAEGGVAEGPDFGRLLEGSLGSGQGAVVSAPAVATAQAVPVVQDTALLQAGPVPTAGPIPQGPPRDSDPKPHSAHAPLRASKPRGNADAEAFAESAFPGTAETREPAPSPEGPRTGPRRPIATTADAPEPSRVAFGLAVPVPAPWGPLPPTPSVDVVTTGMPTNPEATASLPEDSPASSTSDTSVAKPLERRASRSEGNGTSASDPAPTDPTGVPASAIRLANGNGSGPESKPSRSLVSRGPETSLAAGTRPKPERSPVTTTRPAYPGLPTPANGLEIPESAMAPASRPASAHRGPTGSWAGSQAPKREVSRYSPASVPDFSDKDRSGRPETSQSPSQGSALASGSRSATSEASMANELQARPASVLSRLWAEGRPSITFEEPPSVPGGPRTTFHLRQFSPVRDNPIPELPQTVPTQTEATRPPDFSAEPIRTPLPPWTASSVSAATPDNGEVDPKRADPEGKGPDFSEVSQTSSLVSLRTEGAAPDFTVADRDSLRRLQEVPAGMQLSTAAPEPQKWASTSGGSGPDASQGSWIAEPGSVGVPTRQSVDTDSTEKAGLLAADAGKVRELPVQSARNLGWQPAAKVPSSPVEIAGSTPKPAIEPKVEGVFEALRSKSAQTAVAERNELPSDSSMRQRSEGLEKRSEGLGTPDAGEGMSMAYSAIQSEFAGSGETRTPGRAEMSRTGSVVEVASDFSQPPITQEPSVKRFDPAPSEAGSTATPSAPRLDRFAELISTEANILRQFRPGVLSAVVRPDPHSELRIELRLHRGQAEVRASLERGDLEAFKAGWPELQSNLLAQGIALLPLNEAPTAGLAGKNPEPSSFGAADSRSGGRSGQRDNPQDLRGDLAPFGFSGESSRSAAAKSATPTGTVGGTRHLLESWA